MLKTKTTQWFNEIFCSRYDVSLKNKGGMIDDWEEALQPLSWEVATEAIKLLYADSNHKPSINEFKKIAGEVAKRRNETIVKQDDMVFSPLFVQLVSEGNDCRLNSLGQFQQVRYMASQNPTPMQLQEAAQRLRERLQHIYGGQWEIIDYSGCEGDGIAYYRDMREKQRVLQKQTN